MADVSPDPDSGAAGTEYQTVAALRGLGHVVDTVWADALPHRIRHGNLHYALELPHAYRSAMVRRLHNAYDVFHVNQPHGHVAARAHGTLGARSIFVHRSHGFELHVAQTLRPWLRRFPYDRRPVWRRALGAPLQLALQRHCREIARWADGHIVSASKCKEFLHSVLGVPSERIAVIPQGVPDLWLQTPIAPQVEDRLQRLLYVGQFAFVKAPAVLTAAVNVLLRQHPRAEMTWVTSSSDHPAASRLIEPEVRPRVHLLDWRSQPQLLDVYDRHGVFLFPSFFEGFGKTFLEAMARGLCVVASDVGGAHDIIQHGSDGLLVSPGRPEVIVRCCRELWDRPSWAKAISEAARLKVRSYTWRSVAQATAHFYEARLAAKARTMQA